MINEENGRIGGEDEALDYSPTAPVSTDYFSDSDLPLEEDEAQATSDIVDSEISELISDDAENTGTEETHVSAQDYAYKNILQENGKPKTKIWSLVALVFSVASVIISFFTIFGIIAGVLAIGCVLLSRKVLGYFDSISIAAIMLSVFGIVFPIAKLCFDPIFEAIYNL
jgi:hypothetical protein